MSDAIRHLLRMLFFALMILSCDIKAYAQTAPQIPSSADASRLVIQKPERPLEESKNIPDVVSKTDGHEQLSIPGADQIFIVLNSMQFSGITIYDTAKFQAEIQPMLGQKISFQKIIDVVNELNKKYRSDGYIAARVFFPEQDITDGNVRIEASEGIINYIGISGALHPDSAVLAGRLKKLQAGKPFNIKEFEHTLLSINDLPSSRFKSILKPSVDSPGRIDIILVETEIPESTSISLDNYGSQYAGPFQLNFGNTEYSLFSDYDQFDTQVLTSAHDNELVFAQIQYTQPSRSIPGLKYKGSYSGGKTEAGDRLDELDIKGYVQQARAEISYEVPLSRSDFMAFGAQFDAKNAQSQLLDESLYKDKIRVLRLSADYQGSDEWAGANSMNFAISKGLKLLGARPEGSFELSRVDGDSAFTKFTGQYSRLQNLPKNFQALVQFQGQYALSPLLASEEFSFGGSSIGRGYDPSEITGDDGGNLSLELRYNHFGPDTSVPLLQPYVFFDIGKVWQKKDGGKPLSGASAGAGVKLFHRNKFTMNMLAAWPLTLPADNPPAYTREYGPRFLLSLSKSF